MEPLLLRVHETAKAIGLGRSKTYELVSSGVIPSVRVGRSVRVPGASRPRVCGPFDFGAKRVLAVQHPTGDDCRHDRGAAWWCGGDGLSVSISQPKGAWYDFVVVRRRRVLMRGAR